MNFIDDDFVASGKLYDLLNDLAEVHDREIKRECEVRNNDRTRSNKNNWQ